jgi:hypothetical protein
MGTDIHLEVEHLGEDGLWHWIEHPDRECDDEYCTNGLYNELTPNEKMHGQPHYRCKGTGRFVDQFWDDRNYDVFAILADVRNGYGFAGVDTGDGFVPIAEPRGLPDDLGPEIQSALNLEEEMRDDDDYDSYWDNPQRIDLGEHSFSWLTVEEILAYDWTRTTTKRGWVDPWNFELWRRDGKPQGWSGGIEGVGIEHISNAAMSRMLDSGEIEWVDDENTDWFHGRRYTTPLQRSMADWSLPEGSTGATIAAPQVQHYTQVEWEVPYTDQAAYFLKVLQRDIVPLGDPDKVRLVFGFDS